MKAKKHGCNPPPFKLCISMETVVSQQHFQLHFQNHADVFAFEVAKMKVGESLLYHYLLALLCFSMWFVTHLNGNQRAQAGQEERLYTDGSSSYFGFYLWLSNP